MKTDRLTVLANHLDTVEEKAFDLGIWHREYPDCGTVACAMGHACLIQEFREQKLCLAGDPAVPSFGNMVGFGAAAMFFDISYEQARHLFAPECYPSIPRTTPAKVAGRIRELIASAA